MSDGNTYCVNCKRDIPALNFVMHSMHCSRNITLCTLCEEPVPRSEMVDHQTEFHSLKECESCGEKLDVSQLNNHKTDFCPMRRINCSICELELAASEISEHENYCGSRTELCEECGEYVMLKYQKLHLESNHGFLKLDDEPGPTPSWKSGERGEVGGTSGMEISNNAHSTWRAPANPSFYTNFISPSPSKRTNDMPQVNSIPPPHASKAVHKAVIAGDFDRPARNYSLADHIDSDVAALFSDSLHLAKPPTYSKLSSSGYPSGEEDLVALPCEFCEALVPANQLILHQTACRPDLARYEELAAASPLNAQSSGTSSLLPEHSRVNSIALSKKVHNNLTIPSPSLPITIPSPSRRDFSSSVLDETLLPCEFCCESFSVSKLYEHQTQCTQTGAENQKDFSGLPDTVDQARMNPLLKGSQGNLKNMEREAYRSVHKEDLKKSSKWSSGLPHELNTHQNVGRYIRKYILKDECLPPGVQRSNVAHCTYTPEVNPFEDDEGRQALLRQANMMDQINSQLGLTKETSTSQRNHIYTDSPSWVPTHRKQPNRFTASPNSSRNLGPCPSTTSYSQSGRGGRTTGAIPKQKAGTSKSPITY